MNDRAGQSAAARLVPSGQGKALVPGGMHLKISASETMGLFEVFELEGPMGPPPHIHHDHQEVFCVLHGRYTFTLDHDTVEAEAGSVVFVPRGTRHAFKPGPDSRAFVFVAPPGLEGFFEELGAGMAAGKSQDEIREALEGRYDSHPA